MVLILQGETNALGQTQFAVPNSLSRMSYFAGQRLGQREFQNEQTYHLLLQRLFQREAFGTGTVAGLAVSRDNDLQTLPLGVFVFAGLAMDPDGRELLLEKDVTIDVADEPLTPGAHSFDPGPLAPQIQTRWAASFDAIDLALLSQSLVDAGLIASTDPALVAAELAKIPTTPPTLTPPEILRDWLFDQVVGTTFVGLQFREAGTEPAPASLDASCCGDTTCRTSRTQEGVFLVTSTERFTSDFTQDPYFVAKGFLDLIFFTQMEAVDASVQNQVDCRTALCSTLSGLWRGLPPLGSACGTNELPIVCLAEVFWARYPTTTGTQILSVDDCSCRPLAPGGPVIRAFVESLTGCARPETLAPRIISIEPFEGQVFVDTDTATFSPFKANCDGAMELGTGVVDTDIWVIRFYPADGSGVVVYNNATGLQTRTVTPAFIGQQIKLTVDDGPNLLPGTYVWSLPNGTTSRVQEVADDQALDGEPNPPFAAPSGNGIAGGAFEARFVVTTGGGG